MSMSNDSMLAASKVLEHCVMLSRSGWESARLAVDRLERSPISVELSRTKTASMAGIYALRLTHGSGLTERTLDLARFVQALRDSDETFVRFFSISFTHGRALVVISDDLERPLASTMVKGSGANPSTDAVGEVGAIPASRARELCEILQEEEWQAASIAIEVLASSPQSAVPIWLATPLSLARHYGHVSESTESRLGSHMDLDRFTRIMAARDPGESLRLFHIFDPYGWQATCALSGDLSQPLGIVAIKR